MSGLLGNMPHAQLYAMRDQVTDKELQELLAGYEHRAFARELVRDRPWMAASLVPAIPAYYLGKKLGLLNARTEGSLEQMLQGYRGIYEGLLK